MKSYLSALLVSPFLASLSYGQGEGDYINWIRQIQYEENQHGEFIQIIRDNHCEKEGTGDSVLGVPENGALFQLWTMNGLDPTEIWKLDTAIAGSFGPKAKIIITAEDSYAGRPRTRADRPFQVSYEVSGILPNVDTSQLPIDLSKARSVHYTDSVSVGTEPQNSVIFSDGLITEDGKSQRSFANTNIRSEDPTLAHKVMGEETFVVEAFTDVESERVMDTKSIDIFPVPSGTIEGLTSNEDLRSLPTSLRIIVEDAYPGSEIYLEVIQYPNSPDESTIPVVDAHRNTPITQPENSDYTIDRFSDYTPAIDSIVITRLVSKSIFGLEILDESINEIKRNLKVRGSVNSL